jgi:dTDP-4-dehydrorhamnose reductase
MRILLTGARGQLGSDLISVLTHHEILPVTSDEMPVQDADKVNAVVDARQPDLIVNCAAFHRVDECEDKVAETFAVNVHGVRNLALAAKRHNIPLVHYSTDYVFHDGKRPHPETDQPNPKSVYGVSKLSGEQMLAATWPKHFIIRTCGLYGYTGSREKRTNFVESMIERACSGNPLKVVNDQTCTPTATADLARATEKLIGTDAYGLYHLSAAGECTWYEFAKAILEFAGLDPQITPCDSSAFPQKAQRPDYSVLDNAHYRGLGFDDMRNWRDALQSYVAGRAAAGRKAGTA